MLCGYSSECSELVITMNAPCTERTNVRPITCQGEDIANSSFGEYLADIVNQGGW